MSGKGEEDERNRRVGKWLPGMSLAECVVTSRLVSLLAKWLYSRGRCGFTKVGRHGDEKFRVLINKMIRCDQRKLFASEKEK